jgi:hypothetical protein
MGNSSPLEIFRAANGDRFQSFIRFESEIIPKENEQCPATIVEVTAAGAAAATGRAA